jgi:hypothetical protein
VADVSLTRIATQRIPMNALTAQKISNAIRIGVVTNSEQLLHAQAVRSICFMEETGLPARRAFDGNDFQATHIIMYYGDEPIGSSRIRWFNGFAKIERTGIRKAYRSARVLKQTADFIFDHVARKGYSKLITLAQPKYADVWIRVLGFRLRNDRPAALSGDGESFVELVKDLSASPDAISIDTAPGVLLRIEGAWHIPCAFEAGDT